MARVSAMHLLPARTFNLDSLPGDDLESLSAELAPGFLRTMPLSHPLLAELALAFAGLSQPPPSAGNHFHSLTSVRRTVLQ